jgi:hypothetical protein
MIAAFDFFIFFAEEILIKKLKMKNEKKSQIIKY